MKDKFSPSGAILLVQFLPPKLSEDQKKVVYSSLVEYLAKNCQIISQTFSFKLPECLFFVGGAKFSLGGMCPPYYLITGCIVLFLRSYNCQK